MIYFFIGLSISELSWLQRKLYVHLPLFYLDNCLHYLILIIFCKMFFQAPFPFLISLFSAEEPLEMDNILQFLEHNKFPLVTTLTELNSVKVYSSKLKYQVFFTLYFMLSLLFTLHHFFSKYLHPEVSAGIYDPRRYKNHVYSLRVLRPSIKVQKF